MKNGAPHRGGGGGEGGGRRCRRGPPPRVSVKPRPRGRQSLDSGGVRGRAPARVGAAPLVPQRGWGTTHGTHGEGRHGGWQGLARRSCTATQPPGGGRGSSVAHAPTLSTGGPGARPCRGGGAHRLAALLTWHCSAVRWWFRPPVTRAPHNGRPVPQPSHSKSHGAADARNVDRVATRKHRWRCVGPDPRGWWNAPVTGFLHQREATIEIESDLLCRPLPSSLETRCPLTNPKRHRTNPNGTKSFGFCSSVRPANERRMFSGFRPTE